MDYAERKYIGFMSREKHTFNVRQFDIRYVFQNYTNEKGLYAIWGLSDIGERSEKLIYIGKSKNVANRILESIQNRKSIVTRAAVRKFASMSDVNVLEVAYIEKYKPIENEDCKSGDALTIALDSYIGFDDFVDIPILDNDKYREQEKAFKDCKKKMKDMKRRF